MSNGRDEAEGLLSSGISHAMGSGHNAASPHAVRPCPTTAILDNITHALYHPATQEVLVLD